MLPVRHLNGGGRHALVFGGVYRHWHACHELAASTGRGEGGEGGWCGGKNECMERKERVKEEAKGREGKSEVEATVESQQKQPEKGNGP